MAEVVSVKIEGLDQLARRFDTVAPKIGKAIVRRALAAAVKPILTQMVWTVRRRTEFLAQHIAFRVKLSRDELAGRAAIGVLRANYPAREGKHGKGSTIDAASVARFLEFGTRKMRALPFMRQAFEGQKGAALDAFTRAAKAGFEEGVR